MIKLETEQAVQNLSMFENWIGLYGKRYQGGGGGVGNFTDPKTIYHQAYDGATNYHKMPQCLEHLYAEVILELTADIMERMRVKLKKDASRGVANDIATLQREIDKLLELKK